MDHVFSVSSVLRQPENEPIEVVFQIEPSHDLPLTLVSPLQVTGSILGIDDSHVLASLQVVGTIELTCDRCIETYHHEVQINYRQTFAFDSAVNTLPITNNETIDLVNSALQEVELDLPIKRLCRADCPGIVVPA